MKKRLLLFVLSLLLPLGLYAQSGEITGKVTDGSTGEPLPFVDVYINIGGTLTGAATDFDGIYTIKPVTAGSHTVEFSFIGYNTVRQTGVVVRNDKTTVLDIVMNDAMEEIDAVEVVEYRDPLIEVDQTSTGGTLTREEIDRQPTRTVNNLASQAAGVYQSDDGGGLNVKGARSNATDFYIDGVKVVGSTNLPPSAIEQVTVVTGGVPARYGDATGGIINITTRGPSPTLSGGIEGVTSEFLDPYGYNLVNGYLSGPLLTIKEDSITERPLLGFFISGEYLSEQDDDPSSVQLWKVKDDVMDDLRQNPLRPSITGQGFQNATNLITFDDLEEIDARDNIPRNRLSLSGRLDFQPVQSLFFQFGGNLNYDQGGMASQSLGFKNFARRYQLFNSEHTPEITRNVYRVYGRFTQRFGNNSFTTDEDGVDNSSIIQNAYYQIQFDYSKNKLTAQDPIFEDNLFHYGYYGGFSTTRSPLYSSSSQLDLGNGTLIGREFLGYVDDEVIFTPSDINPDLSLYNQSLFEYLGDNTAAYQSLSAYQNAGGLINGGLPLSRSTAYNLYYTPGVAYNNYQESDNDQYRVSFIGAFDLKPRNATERNKHAIEFGFEYEQRIEREHQVSPTGLWDLIRQRVSNPGISDIFLDLDNPLLSIDGELYTLQEYQDLANQGVLVFSAQDTITYDYIRTNQGYFDANFRNLFGFGNLDYVNPFSVDPNQLSLDLFSADELFNNGNGLIDYYGFDYLGNKLTTQPSFSDFFTEKAPVPYNDVDSVYTRPIDAFRPIYMAGFVQDKFNLKDLIFNIGLRVDRFDANQKAPKDLYSPLYETRTVAEVSNLGDHPANVGDDFVVYVDDEVNPTKITGYRDGDQFYLPNGIATQDPSQLGNEVTPYLANPLTDNPQDDIKNPNYRPDGAFEDYEPQINVMPRVAFSFTLSEEATFFAHYDVLAQRPQSRIFASPDDFYYFNENSTLTFNNPNLKPEKTISYQIGFQQRLSQTTALSIAGFYREMRDQVQVTNVLFAYPGNYTTYRNIDFGTVKGLEFTFDLRRTSNLALTANYTLQFADGTGSGDRSQANLVSFGQPNLRTVTPLSYDSRHLMVLNADYRFGYGKKYDGPEGFAKGILQNAGINVTARMRSGEPFTRQANPTPDAQFGVQSRSSLDGNINGSRLPWNFNLDARLEKDFRIGGSEDNMRFLNVYLWVTNILDTQNLLSVYAYTASASDDGYLTSPEGQEAISSVASVESFNDLYTLKVNNPNNFSAPRRIRLGVRLNF